jgi:hypothetical protein
MAGSFAIDIAKWCQKSEEHTRFVIKKIAFEAFIRVIYRSPVDTGRFRANWGVQIGSPFKGVKDEFDKTPIMDRGGSAANNAASDVDKWNGDGSIFLCNNLAYSIALENGHSKGQAPGGMVKLAVPEVMNWLKTVRLNARNITTLRNREN